MAGPAMRGVQRQGAPRSDGANATSDEVDLEWLKIPLSACAGEHAHWPCYVEQLHLVEQQNRGRVGFSAHSISDSQQRATDGATALERPVRVAGLCEREALADFDLQAVANRLK